jgi:hypothetical protein
MGPYPLFACHDWSELRNDVRALEGQFVALSVVVDPFEQDDPAILRAIFPDVVVAFKDAYVTNLGRPPESYISSHHRRNVRKARQEVRTEVCESPGSRLEEWTQLYAHLIARHEITGLRAFSRSAFARQLQVPGLTMLRAVIEHETVGMLLWYERNGVAYYHLGAHSPRGYDAMASFALFACAIEHFSQRGLEWLYLGGGAGIDGESKDGLSRFKKGWATGARPLYFCGRVLDREAYARLAARRPGPKADYFPAYRAGEFA